MCQAPHEQDYEPSSDHFSVMQNAFHYMLIAPADDAASSMPNHATPVVPGLCHRFVMGLL